MRAPATIRSHLPAAGRINRSPQHPFYVTHRPFQLQPMFLAPVLPGETMKSLRLKSRAVTDPLKNGLIGWYLEYYFFYVKHRDLVGAPGVDVDDNPAYILEQMMLDPAASTTALNGTAYTRNRYYHGNGIDWIALLEARLFDGTGGVNWFRTDSESNAVGFVDGRYLIEVKGDSVMNSLIAEGTLDDALDVNVDADANSTITVGEIKKAERLYDLMIENGLTDMDYEDYLATYGVRPRKEDSHIPELVRYVREWTYPSNTIDPADGSPVGAGSWGITAGAQKPRLFKEPGFLIGFTCARPKTYFGNQKGTTASYLSNAYNWLPALVDDPRASFQLVPDGAYAAAKWPGVFGDITDAGGAYFDMRDLFIYGEQFTNADLSGAIPTDQNFVALPTAALGRRYVASGDMDNLFVGAAPLNQIRQDGIVSLTISGRQQDLSEAI